MRYACVCACLVCVCVCVRACVRTCVCVYLCKLILCVFIILVGVGGVFVCKCVHTCVVQFTWLDTEYIEIEGMYTL